MSKILIVEDEKQYRDLLQEKLKHEGFEVLTAQNGQEALSTILTHGDINLILLDLLMPQMDGLTFFYKLKNELKRNIPVIILTNLTDTPYPSDSNIRGLIIKSNTNLTDVVSAIKKTIS
jgi:CheY-like chemotaxis protein